METRNVGRSGLSVSLVGLGCNNFGARLGLDATREVVDAALEAGVTFFDTSDNYGNRGGSETLLGEILGARRNRVVLATKFGTPMDDGEMRKGASRRYIVSAVEDSLRRLRTDWIDLYQLHRPDAATPIEETLRALDDLVHDGKVRYIGCSNLSAWQIVDAVWTARHHGLSSFVCTQDEYSLLVRDRAAELFPALQATGLGFLPYYPLASGLLTGKYRRGATMPQGTRLSDTPRWTERFLTDRNQAIVERLADFCASRNRTLTELAIGWLASQPQVSSVIAGATSAEQVLANAKAAQWRLDASEMAEVNRLTQGTLDRIG